MTYESRTERHARVTVELELRGWRFVTQLNPRTRLWEMDAFHPVREADNFRLARVDLLDLEAHVLNTAQFVQETDDTQARLLDDSEKLLSPVRDTRPSESDELRRAV